MHAHTERQRERAIEARLHRKALESVEKHGEEALLCEIVLELLLVLLEGGTCQGRGALVRGWGTGLSG